MNQEIYSKIEINGSFKTANWQNLVDLLRNLYNPLSLRTFQGSATPSITDAYTRTHWAVFGKLLIQNADTNWDDFKFSFYDRVDTNRFINIEVDCRNRTINLSASLDNEIKLQDAIEKIKNTFGSFNPTTNEIQKKSNQQNESISSYASRHNGSDHLDKSKVAKMASSIFTAKFGVFAILGAIAALGAIYVLVRGCKSDHSYRHEVLQELQNARDCLAYTLICRKLNWRRPASFRLMHMDKVPELFYSEPALRKDVRFLYESVDGGMKQAAELRHLLAQEDADPVRIQNLERSIEKIVSLADSVGPQVAAFVGATWQTPSSDLTLEALQDYYEGIVTPTATDSEVESKWGFLD